jgi:hypothetical protein
MAITVPASALFAASFPPILLIYILEIIPAEPTDEF